jgi:DNA-binding CsgD family transcriptional regulator
MPQMSCPLLFSFALAKALHISVPTVNTHIRRIYDKLHVRSRSQAIAKFTHIPNATVTE